MKEAPATSRLRVLPFLLLVCGAAFLLSFYKIASWDVFWHLAVGQEILESGRLIVTNYFSGIFPDHPWPNPEWLFQVIVAVLYGAGGWEAVTVLKVLLAVLIGAVIFFACLRSSGRPLLSFSLALTSLCAMQFRFSERPHLFSYLFMVLLVAQALPGKPGEKERWKWALPVIFMVWSNIHPELIIGLFFIFAVRAGAYLDTVVRGEERPLLMPQALLLGICIAAVVINPETYHVLLFPFLHLFLGPMITVTEYVVTTPAMAPIFWLSLPVVWLIVLKIPARRSWREILPLAGLSVFSLLYLRSTPYFFIAAAPIVARHLVTFRPRRFTFMNPHRVEAAALLAGCAALTWALGFERLVPYSFGWGLNERLYPAAAAEAILENDLPPVLYNDYAEGGYVIHKLYPRYGVFQDGRVQAYPREFIARMHANFSLSDWPAFLEEYGVNTALSSVTHFRSRFPSHTWGVVFWDDRWCVLLRKNEANRSLLERLEYRFFLPGVDITALKEGRLLEILAGEMVRNQEARFTPSAFLFRDLGMIYSRLGMTAKARSALEKALELEPALAESVRMIEQLPAEFPADSQNREGEP